MKAKGNGIRIVPAHKRLVNVGDRFSRLTAIGESFYMNQLAWVVCRCDCGTHVVLKTNTLRSGTTKSCGCLQKEVVSRQRMKSKTNYTQICTICGVEYRVFPHQLGERITCSVLCGSKSVGIKNTKHGESRSRIYNIWHGMKARCTDSNLASYSYYGGRGISVCDEWMSRYESFRDWSLANGYNDSLSIDRINNNGNYEPCNCRWANRSQQMSNTRKRRNAKTSKFKGVSRHSQNCSWVAQSGEGGQVKNIGSFRTELAAAIHYDDYVYESRGEFASLNFPERKRQPGKPDTVGMQK